MAETKTLSLGCPCLWCHSCHLFLEDRNAETGGDADAVADGDIDGEDGRV
jgi:hypothetical protein